jgi:hypothetical protein
MCGFVWMILDKKCRWGCAACPAGATCAGDLYQPVADPGYWIDRSAAAVKGHTHTHAHFRVYFFGFEFGT